MKLNRQQFISMLNEHLNTKYSSQALYSWERGKAIPPADLIPPLAYLLNLDILELFGIEPTDHDKTIKENLMLKSQVEQLNKKVTQQAEQILKLEGKMEASDAFLDKLMGQLRVEK